jgi:lipopolysaccharide biosynthesis regulator YciM
MTGWNLPPGCTDRMVDEALGCRDETRFECTKCGFVIDMEDDAEWQCIHCGTWNNVEPDPDEPRDGMMSRMLDEDWDR